MKIEPTHNAFFKNSTNPFNQHWKQKSQKKKQQEEPPKQEKETTTITDELSTTRHLWYA